MNTRAKGDAGENKIITIFRDHNKVIEKKASSGSIFRDGDLEVELHDKPFNLIIDSKNEEKVSKTLLNKLAKINEQAHKNFDVGAIVDFDEDGSPIIHMKLKDFIEII
jgi:hypothetical protein